MAFSQVNNTKRDTLYYLIDTAKVPVNDRIVKITDAPLFKFYYFSCPCLDQGQMPYLIHRTKDIGEILSHSKLSKFKLTGTAPLLYLFHQNYYRFNSEHIVYILEVLSSRKIAKHLVTTGAIDVEM